jgi:hypothetical protein
MESQYFPIQRLMHKLCALSRAIAARTLAAGVSIPEDTRIGPQLIVYLMIAKV